MKAVVACVAAAVALCLLQSMGYFAEREASSSVVFLAILAGLIGCHVIPDIFEVRLDRKGFAVHQPWGVRRYRWQDISIPFHVVAGSSGPEVAFTVRNGSATVRESLQPDCLELPAANLATLLNEWWDRARRQTWQEVE
jgi:hypothetical protein